MATATLRCATSRILTVEHAPAAAAVVGDILLVNGRVLVAYDDLAISEAGQWMIKADEMEVPKAAGEAWAAGDVVYWDDTAKAFTKTATANTKAGYVQEAALTAATLGIIALDNTLNM